MSNQDVKRTYEQFLEDIINPFVTDWHKETIEESHYMAEIDLTDAMNFIIFLRRNYQTSLVEVIENTVIRYQTMNDDIAIESFRELVIEVLYTYALNGGEKTWN